MSMKRVRTPKEPLRRPCLGRTCLLLPSSSSSQRIPRRSCRQGRYRKRTTSGHAVAPSISTWILQRDEVIIPGAGPHASSHYAPWPLGHYTSTFSELLPLRLRRHRLVRADLQTRRLLRLAARVRVRRADWRGSAHLERHWQPEKRAARWQGLSHGSG